MSIPVELTALEQQVASSGPMAFLVTANDDGRPHTVAVQATWDAGRLRAGAGARTAGNVGRRPGVSMLWPTMAPGAYSLIVDGTASVEAGEVVVQPTRAVLHRTPVGTSGADPDAPSCITIVRSA